MIHTWKRPEALGTDEAVGVEKFSIRVDDFGLWFESIVASSAGHAIDVHYAAKDVTHLRDAYNPRENREKEE